MQGRHADQRRDLLPRERPQLGELQQQRPGTHRPNARGTLQQIVVVPPQRAGPERRLEVVVQRGQACIEPGIGAALSVWRRPLVPVRRCCAAVRMPMSCWRRPSRARNSCVWASGSGRGVGRITSAKCASARASNASVLANCPVARAKSRAGRGLTTTTGRPAAANAAVAARSRPPVAFQHDQRGVEGPQPVHERRDATGIVGDSPALPRGTQGNIELGFRNINTHKTRHVNHRNSCLPDLADTGSMAPNNCTGSGSPGRDDPRSAPVSRTKATSVCHVRGLRDGGFLPHHPLKIQGCRASAAVLC